MSTATTEKKDEAMEFGTKPQKEHEWLNKLVGEWETEAEMFMGPDQPPMKSKGTQSITNFGGLFAFGEGTGDMPNGKKIEYKIAIGYDVSFKEYRMVRIANMSSHIWNGHGQLSADGKTLTLDCVGPNMVKDGETANYRDVIEIIDDNNRTLKSYGQDENGNWQQFMINHHRRIR